MQIAIIEPIGGHGGMDYYDYGLAMGLALNDIHVILYTSNDTNKREFKNVNTIQQFKNIWAGNKLMKICKYIFYHFAAYRDAKKRGIEIVHLHFFDQRIIDWIILYLAHVFKFKIVVTFHDVRSFDKSASEYVSKKCFRLIDGIVVHNNASFRMLPNYYTSLKEVIPHGNYLPFIEKIDVQHHDDNRFNLLFFGQVKKVKGLDVLLRAVKLLKDKKLPVHLMIAGKPWKSDLDYYRSLITELNIQDYVTAKFEYIADANVSDYFKHADLVVLPYRKIYQSGVLLLSMSYGIPILCSDLEAFTEVVRHGENGIVFKTEDESDLALKIAEIIENKALLEQLSLNSKKIVSERYDWKLIGKRTKEFYLKLL